MCRKWVQSQWALVQHLRSKHGLSEEASKVEAEAAWVKKLEELSEHCRSRKVWKCTELEGLHLKEPWNPS